MEGRRWSQGLSSGRIDRVSAGLRVLNGIFVNVARKRSKARCQLVPPGAGGPDQLSGHPSNRSVRRCLVRSPRLGSASINSHPRCLRGTPRQGLRHRPRASTTRPLYRCAVRQSPRNRPPGLHRSRMRPRRQDRGQLRAGMPPWAVRCGAPQSGWPGRAPRPSRPCGWPPQAHVRRPTLGYLGARIAWQRRRRWRTLWTVSRGLTCEATCSPGAGRSSGVGRHTCDGDGPFAPASEPPLQNMPPVLVFVGPAL